MWNKKERRRISGQDDPPRRLPRLRALKKTPLMPTVPSTSYHPPERGMAVIGKSVMIKGEIVSRERPHHRRWKVEGFPGNCTNNRLTVGPHGKVRSGVKGARSGGARKPFHGKRGDVRPDRNP